MCSESMTKILTLTILFATILGTTLIVAAVPAYAVSITLIPISAPFNSPIGIDHHEPTNSIVMPVNYITGNPHNFERVLIDGTTVQFSAVSGVFEEVKIATVRSGNTGGFTTGDLYTGNGVDGEIMKISADGTTVTNPWVSLPGAGNGLLRGSLYVDRTTVYGDDLIVVTTGGEVWRITSAGAPTQLADVNTHLEGVITVPNDAVKYGTLAGKIIAGAEAQGLMYVFDNGGFVTTHDFDIDIEDIDLIDASENFYGINFGTGRLLGAAGSDFAAIDGDILLTQEFGGVSGLFRLFWNGATLQTEAITLNQGSFDPGQWEHVTFSTAGVPEIPPTPQIEKILFSGPEEIGIYLQQPTQYVYTIEYAGPAALVIDTVPAEFEVLSVVPSNGDAIFFETGKGQGKSSTKIEWDVPVGINTLTVTIETVQSKSQGKVDGVKVTVYKPTSCGPLSINDGATPFEVDEQGNLVLDPPITGVPIPLTETSNSLEVEGIEGSKPCSEG